jgi:indolepyruvate ferredoxin oxidoreductase alpha subunit
MAERSFAEEVGKLRLGEGETFRGEGILAVTKALLESGVAYVAGYQGAPISHLMDVLADAEDILVEHGIRFENSASEATAAATLAASVNYPLRGAVTFKGPVGVNVASDALANLASGGVRGGALVIVGEDYGEGSSIMQERSHAFAMKSQIWLLDPRPNLPSIVAAVKQGFELSEASRTPVMLQLRIRACHVYGRFTASANRRSPFTLQQAMDQPVRQTDRIALPPATYAHEREKIAERWPAAVRFIEQRGLNEFFDADGACRDLGIVVQGGHYNTVVRGLERLGLADVYGRSQVPLYVMNVAYPVIDAEVLRFCSGKRAVLVIEEGQPNFVEQNIANVLRQGGSTTALHGKDVLPMAGEYVPTVVRDGLRAFLERYGALLPSGPAVAASGAAAKPVIPVAAAPLADVVHGRPPGFCTGCPERPIFSAMKLVERELGPHHVSADIGCHLFSILPPFNIGNTTMGYGLGTAGASAFNPPVSRSGPAEGAPPAPRQGKRAISVMGDGGFWHNGLTSGIAHAVFNRSDNLTIVVDNNYTSATGGQDLLSSKLAHKSRSTGHAIERAVRGVGVGWVRTLTNTYKVSQLRDTLREALTNSDTGPKVLVAQSECMLNRQRREKPLVKKAVAAGERVVRERFGVDEDTCTGDHSCIRLNGCPSLSIKPNPDPLRSDPVATVIDSCVGCGVCGEVSHAAVLCPSFYKARIVSNPTRWDRLRQRVRGGAIAWLQRRDARRRARYAFPAPALPADDGTVAAPSQAPGAAPPRVDSASVEPRPGSSEAPRERVLR